jgi:hypothetical protein
MIKLTKVLLLAAIVPLAVACGSSGTSTTELSTVDTLPRATSPVVSATSGSISALNITKSVSVDKASATTGVNLKNMAATTFTTGDSIDLCQAANQTKQIIENAAMADFILCNVQQIVASDTTGQLASIYDGNWHVFRLSLTGGEGQSPDHVKMRIIKTGNTITSFEMFACASGTQKEYIKQLITGTEATITSKGFFSGGSWFGAHQIEVTGVLNSSGNFTSKTMDLDQYGGLTQGAQTQWSEATVTQYADKMIFDGYDRGSFGGGDYQNRVYAQYQLIDTNTSAANSSYDISKIAVGNGAAHGIFASGPWTGNQSVGWNGDTKLSDNTVTVGDTATTWLSLVTSTDPRNTTTAPTIAFTADQTYNCNETEEVTITGDDAALTAACSKFSFGHTWVDCYNVIQPQ